MINLCPRCEHPVHGVQPRCQVVVMSPYGESFCHCSYSTSGTARQTVPDDGPDPPPPGTGPSSPPDGGVGAPPGPHDPSPDAATSSPTPPSLEMQVERCRVLLDLWRRERLAYKLGQSSYDAYAAAWRCETELREALGDEV